MKPSAIYSYYTILIKLLAIVPYSRYLEIHKEGFKYKYQLT